MRTDVRGPRSDVRRSALALLALGALAGCVRFVIPAPVAEPGEAEFAPTPAGADGVRRAAVVAGLTRVDAAAYGGWTGDCPGCDVDADVFGLLCHEQDHMVTLLKNEHATRANVMRAARAAWAGMKAGDLFVLFVSGHGGQDADTNGDEVDGQDETLCLWDGQLSDDMLGALWQEMPPGVRVLFVTDTCNSGTNYKRRSIVRTIPRNYAGELIHFGGCADGLSAYGSDQGGTWTTALIDAWAPTNSVLGWFEAAAAKMPRRQVPAYAEHGNVTDGFRHGKALR